MPSDLMAPAGLDVEWQGDVAVLHWRADDNRLNAVSVDGLNAALDAIEREREGDAPLAVVLTGEGKFFSNGLDLDWMASAGAEGATFVDRVHRLFARVLLYPATIIAAINGHAFAAGAMLAAATDFQVMRDDRGFWCLPEADLGLPLTPAMHAVIGGKLPRVAAREAMMTGRRYSGTEALAAGIVQRTASEAEVVPSAVAWATELAPKSRAVVARHKVLLNGPIAAVCEAGGG
jgi:enoyl-CoA hydratase/carnithine racemase